MTTILIWLGSGFSFAVGLWVGALLMRREMKPDPKVEETIKALQDRNAIGQAQVRCLERIAKAIEQPM